MFDALKRALTGDEAGRAAEQADELRRLREGVEQRRALLDQRRASRLAALFPQGPVEGFRAAAPGAPARFPGLDPFNFEETEAQGWLITMATQVIDRFPGGESLLSQLDATFRAFSDANHYRIDPAGPHAELLGWRDEALATWDLRLDVPVYLAAGGGHRVLGCAEPFVVLDRYTFEALAPGARRFVFTAALAHVFFGNLRIFAFHRLMEILDRMPSMGGLITQGLGLIPVVGATISRGIELARTVNDQLIRKTNLVVGLRQHLLCDRLALLATNDQAAAEAYFVQTIVGDVPEPTVVHARLVEQGRLVFERFERGEVDLHMLSVVGPGAPFAAFRAFRLRRWLEDARAGQIARGLYVTRERLAEYRQTHRQLEEEIRALEARLLELHERIAKLEAP